MEITNQRVLDGLAALRAIENPGKPLSLSGLTRLALAKNMRRLKDAAADFEAAVAPLRAQVVPGEKTPPEVDAEFQKVLKAKVEVVIGTIRESALDLEKKVIPIESVGDLLDWMVVADNK